jgi:hypothetical protein
MENKLRVNVSPTAGVMMVVLGNMKEMSECYDIDKLMKFIGGLGRFMDEVFIAFEPEGFSGVFVVMG